MSALLQRLNRPIVAILAVAALAGIARGWALANPPDLVFDEVYYAKAGCLFVGGSDQTCFIDEDAEHYWVEHKWDVGSWVHPPLGKWMTGMGIKAFGMDAFGWRFPSAVAGTLIAVMVALIAQLLFGRPLWTFVAGGLIALDGLNVVMSRVAMFDIHLAFWVVLGFLCLVLDRRWIDRRTERALADEPVQTVTVVGEDGATVLVEGRAGTAGRGRTRVPSPLWRPWRFASGAALGAACAVKWSGLTALAAAVLVTVVWETTRRHVAGVSRWRAFWRTVGMELLGLILAFLVVPVDRVHGDLAAVVQPLRVEPVRVVGEPEGDVALPRQPHRIRLRLQDRHVHAHPRFLFEGMVVDLDETSRQLLRGEHHGPRPADPHDRQPRPVLGHGVRDPVCACGRGRGPATGVRASW